VQADAGGPPDGRPLVLGAFFAGSVLAGGNAVAVRYSNRELDPLWGAGLRFALAAACFASIMAVFRIGLPRGRSLGVALIYGGLNFGVGFGLFYYALQEVHAGLGQVILALVPLLTLVLAVLQGQERFHTRAVVGGAVALAGIALASQAPLRESIPLTSLLAALGCALCFAQAGIVIRGHPEVHAVALNALGTGFGAALLIAVSLVTGETPALPENAETLRAIVYVVPVGTVLVFSLYLFVLSRWVASRTAYQFVLIPIVTLALSAWLDDEELGSGLLLGALLVLVGVHMGAIRPAQEQGPA
jgi:drug/metabolite transporter (DMT)-like permease